MEYFSIDIAGHFACMADKCPYTCCKGWQIPVDEETYDRYRALKGIKGRHYRYQIIKKDPKRIKKLMYRCPFYTSDKLCLHQARGELSYMPQVCKGYPRRIVNFGTYSEATLELSCPKAAEIFLDNPGRREFAESPVELVSLWEIENEDPVFLEFLQSQREKLLDFIWQDLPLYDIWKSIYEYIYKQHEKLTRDKLDEAKLVELKTYQNDRGYVFFKIATIDKMLINHIDRGNLMFRVPKFYVLIMRYMKTYSKMNVEKADWFFNDKIEEMMKAHEHLFLKYRSYFSYMLQQEYMLCYESYSLVREFLFCILYTQLLMLFDSLEFIKKGKLTREREIEILYLTEHNIRHNPYLRRALYSVIREDFF